MTASKYLHALRDGTVPLLFLFSGTVFVPGERGFSVQQVSWECEARHDMPVSVWRDLIRLHYPNTGWVRLGHDTVAALADYRSASGMLDFEDAVTTLLAESSEGRTSDPGLSRVHHRRDPENSGDTRLGTGARHRRRGALRGLPAVPLPRHLGQEPSRWQFGVVGPPGAAAAGIGEDDTLVARSS